MTSWKRLSKPVRVIVALTILLWAVAITLMLTATPKVLVKP